MMVRLGNGVECSAKIAMTTLRSGSMAMGLLPNHVLRRRIFLEARAARNRQTKIGGEILSASSGDRSAIDRSRIRRQQMIALPKPPPTEYFSPKRARASRKTGPRQPLG
jgi:hypothetical protein